jgi:carboxyl-terminal processing protease
MRRALILPAAVVVLAGPFVAGYVLSRPDRATSPVAITAVTEVRDALAARYYRPVSVNVLDLGSVDAMLSALRDPYTAYLTAPSYHLVEHDTAASYSGIGVEVLPSQRGLLVVRVQPGPAAEAGVLKGDVIVRIGDSPVTGIDAAKVLERVVGPPGKLIKLVLDRGGRPVVVDVRRSIVHAPTVAGRMVLYARQRWGVIQLSTFRSNAATLVKEQVERLQQMGAKGFVLDLRGDPGGLLTQAVAVSSLFLDGGVVVSLSGVHYVHEVFRATGKPVTRLPLVVLVDHYTASSAEIVAAALSERGRAIVVGQRTFGKGVVQAVDPLGNDTALVLTVARYFTPDGKAIDHAGVVPQFPAVDNPSTPQDEALLTALRTLAQPAS